MPGCIILCGSNTFFCFSNHLYHHDLSRALSNPARHWVFLRFSLSSIWSCCLSSQTSDESPDTIFLENKDKPAQIRACSVVVVVINLCSVIWACSSTETIFFLFFSRQKTGIDVYIGAGEGQKLTRLSKPHHMWAAARYPLYQHRRWTFV